MNDGIVENGLKVSSARYSVDADGNYAVWVDQPVPDGLTEVAEIPQPSIMPALTRAEFCVALTNTAPPIFTPAEALAALEAFPPKFMAALAEKPLDYQAVAIEQWRSIALVPRDAPLFLDLLAFYAAQAGLTDAQAVALGDAIFAGAGGV